jgi:diguanylate cyclase
MLGGWSRIRRTREWDRGASRWRQITQLVLLAAIASAVVTSVLDVRAHGSLWVEGISQSLAYGAAALLCLVRTPPPSLDRTVPRLVAVGVMFFGLSNLARHEWLVRVPDPLPVTVLCHVLRAAFYICVLIAIVLVVRSRLDRLPLTLGLDGVVACLGAATVAALLAPLLFVGFAQSAITLWCAVAKLLLLTLALGAVWVFRSSPPPSLLIMAGSLLVLGAADCVYAAHVALGSYEPGGLVDAAWVVAVTALALAPGRRERPWIARVPTTSSTPAAPLIAAAAVISVLVAASYVHVSPVVGYLAVATLVAALCRQATTFSEARHAGEQAHLAQTDELTALLNRRGFYHLAAPIFSKERSSDPGQPTCALLLLDLNHFKDFNDSLGHAAGDELLRWVAARLSASLGEGDILARLGGDEFALILPNVGIDRAMQTAVALTAALEQTVVLDGLHVQIGASIGIVVGPDHGRDLGTLLRHADIAMYRAKYDQARYLVYTPEAKKRPTTRYGLKFLAQLRDAIAHGELTVHYQPKLRLATGEIAGVEALVRWDHPERGLLYPDQFLPLARHNALMYAMTDLVVQRVLDDAAVWHARGHRVPVAINLCPPTLADLDLPARLDDALRRKGLTSAALAVEITEDFVLGNLDRGRHVLDGLHRLGISIAIDNFGSGSSSLNHFRHLPIDEVKLDRSLIASITEDPRVAAIVRSVIDLSRTLGLTTVAEGVETPATAAVLTGYGCDVAQGHHYCQPHTATQILHLLEQLTGTAGGLAADDQPARARVTTAVHDVGNPRR